MSIPARLASNEVAPNVANRIDVKVELNYEIAQPGADFVFNIHAAHTPNQLLRGESLVLTPPVASRMVTDPVTRNRCVRVSAEAGPLRVTYAVSVDLMHVRGEPARIREVSVAQLPSEVLVYVYPSRYCQSDRLVTLASAEFGHLARGYGRVQAICDWVHGHVRFKAHSSNVNTSAVDTLIERVGVCRNFAHLMIALCRALNIPARFASGTDYGADPALGPPDFQAYVEVYLGERWYIFDPSGTAIPMASCGLAPGAMLPTWLSRPSSVPSSHGHPWSAPWPSKMRLEASCVLIFAEKRCRPTAATFRSQRHEFCRPPIRKSTDDVFSK